MGVADLLTGLLPRPSVDEHACSRRLGSGCSVCVDACPKQALRITTTRGRDDHAPVVDPLLCVGCGLCEAQCPVEAISGVSTAADRIVSAAHGRQVLRLRCEAARTSGAPLETDRSGAVGLDVGCLASLHPETVAAAAGALVDGGAVELMHGDCDRCPLGAGAAVSEMVADAGASLAGAGRIHVGQAPDEGGTAEVARRPSTRMNRRSLFRKVSPRHMAEEAVLSRASLRGGQTPRDLLLQSVAEPALPRPEVQPGCTACRACINVCPTGALSADGADDVFELFADPALCVGCNECVRVCPEDVVSGSLRLPDRAPLVLATVSLCSCDTCGMPLSPGESHRCAMCSSRQSMISDVWSQYGLQDDGS